MSSKSHIFKGKKKSQAKGKQPDSLLDIPHPPTVNGLELRHSVTLRYRVVTGGRYSITFQNLLDTLCVAIAPTILIDLFQAVKIRRVRIWSNFVPMVNNSSISLEYSGTSAGLVGDHAIHTDTAIGISPAYISAKPSSRSLAYDYQVSSASVAFTLNVNAGDVIDLELSFRSQYALLNAPAFSASVGSTAGAQYIRSFDGLATAGANFTPEYAFAQA